MSRDAQPAEAMERAADELYGLPAADFTQARDELARRLRNDGARDEANAVKALRKPTVAAWALNQLARRRRKDVERLLQAGQELRESQEDLLTGGDRSRLQQAARQERDLVAKLSRDATALAGEAGAGTTASLQEKVAGTLHAAALDEEAAAELAAGRLVREREAVGGFGAGPAPSSAPRKRQRQEKAPPDAERRRRVAAARDDERRTRRILDAATKKAEQALKRAEQAQQEVEEAASRAEAARDRLEEAQSSESEARAAHERAVGDVELAQQQQQ